MTCISSVKPDWEPGRKLLRSIRESVVTKDVKSYAIMAGIPAKKIGNTNE